MSRNNMIRCPWCGSDPLYMKYHDEEWGKQMKDEQRFFEFLTLEAAQAGLSWITILKRRESYRNAFAGFDAVKVAAFTSDDVDRLMTDAGIIRNRLKIEAAINNAKVFLELQQEYGSFYNYLYRFLPEGKPIINSHVTQDTIPARTELSDILSKDMKKRGFKFFGTLLCYAFMQATGMVNDHIVDCSFRDNN